MVSEIGAKPSVGDSPALVSARKVLTQLGVLEELEKRGVEVLEFEEITPISGSTFRSLEVATEVLQADKVINFCKLKTDLGLTGLDLRRQKPLRLYCGQAQGSLPPSRKGIT
ncbi:MAG: DUF362 domain-containing protein [Planctomycetota bacterium]|nr:DUF362 domain-containing protein [Planctomycetota bacterium]